jgi:hypothetical protein
MIRGILITLLGAAGAGIIGLVAVLVIAYWRAGPEFPPPGTAQRDA